MSAKSDTVDAYSAYSIIEHHTVGCFEYAIQIWDQHPYTTNGKLRQHLHHVKRSDKPLPYRFSRTPALASCHNVKYTNKIKQIRSRNKKFHFADMVQYMDTFTPLKKHTYHFRFNI